MTAGTMLESSENQTSPLFEVDVSHLKGALPSDSKGCLELMAHFHYGIGCFNSLAFWTLGRIVMERRARDPELIRELCDTFNYKKRTVDYALQFYKRFAEPEDIVELSIKGTTWTGFKNLSGIKDDAARKLLVEAVKKGETSVDDVNRGNTVEMTSDDSIDDEVETPEKDPTPTREPDALGKELLAFWRKACRLSSKYRETISEHLLDLQSWDDVLRDDPDLDVDIVSKVEEMKKDLKKELTLIRHELGQVEA